MTTVGEHRFLPAAGGDVLQREVRTDPSTALPQHNRYELPSFEAVDLSYAGRLRRGHAAHDAIASAQVGDDVRLVRENERWALRDHRNRPLGRMAKAWQPPSGMTLANGRVGAVVRWRKNDNEEPYREWLQREEWETVLPELEFVGEDQHGRSGRPLVFWWLGLLRRDL